MEELTTAESMVMKTIWDHTTHEMALQEIMKLTNETYGKICLGGIIFPAPAIAARTKQQIHQGTKRQKIGQSGFLLVT